MLKLGNIILDVPFLQAPLSGYSDRAMRKLAVSYGAPFVFAGMMLAKSAAHPKVLKHPAVIPGADEHPIGAQILGNNPDIMAKAAKGLVSIGYDLIDLNFACPAPKVLRQKRGGFLIKQPETALEIYQRVRDAVDCPVTVKLRTSFDNSPQCIDNFRQICLKLSQQNVDAITVHGRSVMQKFRKAADWKILAQLKQEIPNTTIIGSGDLFDADKIIELIKTTRIDGVAIARGAIGNPWIYSCLRAAFLNEPVPASPTLYQQGQLILKHFELVCQLHQPAKAVRYFRKFLVAYCKLHPHRKKAQQALLATENKKQLTCEIKKWYHNGQI